MARPFAGLLWVLLCGIAFAEVLPDTMLITPESFKWSDGEGVELPADALRRCGSGRFRFGSYSRIAPTFSPSGKTLYVGSTRGVIGFDPATGLRNFEYRQFAWNCELIMNRTEGIRIDYQQGPDEGHYVVLQHDAGKLLRRSKPRYRPWKARGRMAPLADERRGLAVDGQEYANPGQDSKPIAHVTLWDLDRDVELLVLGQSDQSLRSVTFSRDQRRLAFLSRFRTLLLVETETGKELCEVPLGLDEEEWEDLKPTWRQDGRKVYIWRKASPVRQLVEIDVEGGEPRVVVTEEGDFPWRTPVVSPHGKYLAYLEEGDKNPDAEIWRVIKLDDLSLHRSIDARPARCEAVFSPDDSSLWLQSECGLARYDLAAGEFATSRDALMTVSRLAFSGDGKLLYGVAGDEQITWAVHSGKECRPRMKFDDFARSGGRKQCIWIDPTGKESLWRTDDPDLLHVVEGKVRLKLCAGSHAISADKKLIVHDDHFGALMVSDFGTGEPLHEIYPRMPSRRCYKFALTPNSCTLAVARRDHLEFSDRQETVIEFWDLRKPEKVGQCSLVTDMSIALQFTEDGRQLQVWHTDQVSLFDVASGKLEKTEPSGFQYDYFAFHMRPFREVLDYDTGFSEFLLQRFPGRNQTQQAWKCFQWRQTAVAFLPQQALLAVASPEGPVVLVDTEIPSRLPQRQQLPVR